MAEMTAPDPERVHALLVGIEQYPHMGDGQLPGAAADAMRLARWLRRRGVPGGNIRLLLAPLPGSWPELNTRAKELGVAIDPVTSRDQIIDRLASPPSVPDGDVLYVYWGGHGVLDRGDRRLLLCPDDSAERRSLDLMDLRDYLTRPDVARCRRQVFLVDACATFVRAGDRRPDVAALPAGGRAAVEQFLLLAAAAGQAATQRGAQRTGAFSTAVMDWLEEHSPGLDTDLDALVAHVKEHFTGHRLGNRQLQTPVTLVIKRLGGDDVEIWERPGAPGVKRAKRAPADRSGGAGVWAGGGVLALVAMVAIVAMFLADRRGAGRKDEADPAEAPAVSGAPVTAPSPTPSPSASASRSPSPVASSGTPTAPVQAAGAPLEDGELCAGFLPTTDAPGVEEKACVWREGTAVYMRAYVRAASRTPVKAKVYLWLSLRDGNKYLYPAGGVTSRDVTVGPQTEREPVTEKVTLPLKPGTEYEVHVSTKLPNVSPPNAPNNPAVTGHGQWFKY
ncbi:caspase family protein [Streptomyces sp. WAC07149]|uniref:caspase family protein n=1 Tax=Streptomyces sp. WAC07149 TaxID=2487425 RepID=UPI000F788BEE|nr:caspase family protein [Streptomyces sp. WAC07149]RST07290.1 caspase family protein [Streptomyces sp. WAC07149]